MAEIALKRKLKSPEKKERLEILSLAVNVEKKVTSQETVTLLPSTRATTRKSTRKNSLQTKKSRENSAKVLFTTLMSKKLQQNPKRQKCGNISLLPTLKLRLLSLLDPDSNRTVNLAQLK